MLTPPPSLLRTAHRTQEAWRASAAALVDDMAEVAPSGDLASTDVLDYGCGTKIVCHLVNEGVAVRRYVGIDTDPRVIDWLDAQELPSGYSFEHLSLHNDLYNPDGRPMSDLERLPVEPGTIDLVSMFSVFTHLLPSDVSETLRLLRPVLRPDGRILVTAMVNEVWGGSHGILGKAIAAADVGTISTLRRDADLPSKEAMHFHYAATGDEGEVHRSRRLLSAIIAEGQWQDLRDRVVAHLDDPVLRAGLVNCCLPEGDEHADRVRATLSADPDADLSELARNASEPVVCTGPDVDDRFGRPAAPHLDAVPEVPMEQSVFSREHLQELIAAQGFELETIRRPTRNAHHGLVLGLAS